MSGLARRAVVRGYRIAAFAVSFTAAFLRANAVVAWEILTPGHGIAPAIVRLPLRCQTPFEIASMISLVTLTPGTLALALRGDPPVLAVHGMHAADVEAFRAQLHGLEDRMLAAIRPVGDDTARPRATNPNPTRGR